MAIRTRNLYKPNEEKPYKLSRSKVENFVSCKRCFFIDRKLGVGQPDGFPFNINIAVDDLLKKEFDSFREKNEPHPYMNETNRNLIPFKHEMIDEWRSMNKGVQYHDTKTNFILYGAVDDLWFDLDSDEVIVADYKATAKYSDVSIDEEWQGGYRRQMDFYQWLLRKNGFKVSNSGFFVYCNGDKNKEYFDNKVHFKVSILEYVGNTDWIEGTITEIKELLDQDTVPDLTEDCKHCIYIKDTQDVV